NIIYNSGGFDYITVDNLNITGAINNAVYLTSADDFCTIQNCDISFCGNNGIDLGSGTNCIVDNNSIRDCNSNGIYSNYGFLSTITNNTITNIGIIVGQTNYKQGIEGIYLPGNGGVISYNTIRKVGYNGITLRYTGGSTVSYNYIDSVCLVLNDGGGIYMSNAITSPRIIDHNIITNAIGNVSGTPGYGSSAEGIYLDEYSSSVVVTNNTVANSGNSGFKLHKAHNDMVTDNTAYNCQTGIDLQNSSVITDYIHDISLRRNIFFPKTVSQNAMYFHTTYDDNITLFGIADSNYYARPVDDNQIIKVSQPSSGLKNMNLASWQAFSLQDAHSKKSPITLTNANDIRFEFNATKTPTTISLGGKYITADSKIYDGSISLQPYTSAVLMKYNNTAVESQLGDCKGIKIFPNPISNQFSIEVEGDNVNRNFEILSSTGQHVLNGKIYDKTAVDSSKLSSGIYFVKIDRGSDIGITKIIKL
ncbi:MAG: right-handed parallel beta-helix repeat-containing protein, partial [Paludibacter sp.]